MPYPAPNLLFSTLPYRAISYPSLSYPFLSFPILPFPILSYQTGQTGQLTPQQANTAAGRDGSGSDSAVTSNFSPIQGSDRPGRNAVGVPDGLNL